MISSVSAAVADDYQDVAAEGRHGIATSDPTGVDR